MKTEYGASPAMVLKYIKPLLFVLILPVIKAVINYLQNGGVSYIIVTEVLLLCAVVYFAYKKYKSFKLSINGNYLCISEGVFFKSKSEINLKDISCLTVSVSYLDMLFGSAYVRINTEAGSNKKCDFEFRLNKKTAVWLYNAVYEKEPALKVKYSFLRLALSVAAYTSVITGVIIGVPLINNAGKLLGYGIKDYLLNELNTVSVKFNRYVPPIVNAVTITFVFFYVIAFVYSLLKYGGFCFYIGKKYVEIKRGIVVKVHTKFNKNAVNCMLAEQNFMLRLLKLYSVKLSIGGFGVGKGETSVMDPCCSRHNAHIFLSGFFPEINTARGTDIKYIRPHKKTLLRFFNAPFWWYLGITAGIFAAGCFFTFLSDFLLLIAATVTLVFVYFLSLRYFCYSKGCVVLDDVFSVQTVKGFKTAEFYCPKEKVGKIKLIRWPLDFKNNTVSIRVTVLNEHGDTATALFVDYNEVEKSIYNLYKIKI